MQSVRPEVMERRPEAGIGEAIDPCQGISLQIDVDQWDSESNVENIGYSVRGVEGIDVCTDMEIHEEVDVVALERYIPQGVIGRNINMRECEAHLIGRQAPDAGKVQVSVAETDVESSAANRLGSFGKDRAQALNRTNGNTF